MAIVGKTHLQSWLRNERCEAIEQTEPHAQPVFPYDIAGDA